MPNFLQDEFEMNMRLLGARSLKEIVPAMLDTSSIKSHHVSVPEDRLYNLNCAIRFYLPVLSRMLTFFFYRPSTAHGGFEER